MRRGPMRGVAFRSVVEDSSRNNPRVARRAILYAAQSTFSQVAQNLLLRMQDPADAAPRRPVYVKAAKSRRVSTLMFRPAVGLNQVAPLDPSASVTPPAGPSFTSGNLVWDKDGAASAPDRPEGDVPLPALPTPMSRLGSRSHAAAAAQEQPEAGDDGGEVRTSGGKSELPGSMRRSAVPAEIADGDEQEGDVEHDDMQSVKLKSVFADAQQLATSPSARLAASKSGRLLLTAPSAASSAGEVPPSPAAQRRAERSDSLQVSHLDWLLPRMPSRVLVPRVIIM